MGPKSDVTMNRGLKHMVTMNRINRIHHDFRKPREWLYKLRRSMGYDGYQELPNWSKSTLINRSAQVAQELRDLAQRTEDELMELKSEKQVARPVDYPLVNVKSLRTGKPP